MIDLSSSSFVIAVLTVIFGLAIILFFGRGKTSIAKSARDSMLLLGPANSGKTVLAHKLCGNDVPETVTSMKATTYVHDATKMSLIDYPGHIRLRMDMMSYIPRAKSIVCVIDAANMHTQARVAAELLYDLFTNAEIEKVSKMVILCNKSDIVGARPAPRVKISLQQELDKIKATRKTLETEESSGMIPLGRPDEPFNFEKDAPLPVTFVAGSAKNDDLNKLTELIGIM